MHLYCGQAAVSANLVSPILIIIVAITAICSFAIPDFSLGFSLRIYRFIYIILGYICGFLGIGVQFIYTRNNTSKFKIFWNFIPFTLCPLNKPKYRCIIFCFTYVAQRKKSWFFKYKKNKFKLVL